MSDFKIVNIIDGNTVQVYPAWQIDLKNTPLSGNKIFIRGLEGLQDNQLVKKRLEKILINASEKITLDAPEVIEATDHENATVSCSVYLSRTNIVYYFPEFVPKH